MRRMLALSLVALFFGALAGAQSQPAAESAQTPRQALIDMFFSQDKGSILRHLPDVTVAKLKEMEMEEQVAAGPPLPVAAKDMDGVKTFATGPVLLSVDLPKGEQFALSVEREEVKGETAFLELGFHGYKQGADRAAGVDPRILIRMIQEGGVWKLADLGFSAHVPLDDPRFLDAMAKEMESARAGANKSGAVGTLRTLNTAQLVYQMTYDRYTCKLADLGGADSGKEPDAHHAQLIDSSLESGKKSGYTFAISHCDAAGKKYRASAVPDKPGEPAYCTDQSGVIKSSEDGKAATCFASGKPLD